jgi:hypothetical protein
MSAGPMSRNPVLWLTIVLPLLAVAGSAVSLLLAVGGNDAPLPERYHWEGSQLDADEARLDAAARRGVSAAFSVDATTGECRVVLRGAAPADLRLQLTHATLSRLDQHVVLQRAGDAYVGRCAPLGKGHWWLELADADGSWLIRERIGS